MNQWLGWIRAYARTSVDGNSVSKVSSRSQSDVCAAWQKWHSKAIEPEYDADKKSWYLALEQARVETLASWELDGIRSNLALPPLAENGVINPEFLYRMARRRFSGRRSGGFSTDSLALESSAAFGVWTKMLRRAGLASSPPRRDWIERQVLCAAEQVTDQKKFQAAITDLIAALPPLDTRAVDEELGAQFTEEASQSVAYVSADAAEMGLEQDEAQHQEAAASESGHSSEASNRPYMAFDRGLDEIGPARMWLSSADRGLLRQLDSPDRQRVQHVARQLQRRLLAQACPRWEFDCTEGALDARRLSRLIVSPGEGRVFRQEIEKEEDQAAVCFLVDVSGSMRPERRIMAALTLDLILQTLDQCGITSEALAYTTRFFHPNPLVEQWRRRGSPSSPGRLNAVRHIVLKSRKQRWKSARESLAILMKDNFGCENIDGEALDWAARRLAGMPERRKLLVVLSDGEPFDEATELANGPLYLEDHLRQVIKALEGSGIGLSGIGYGSQVARFYRNSLAVSRSQDLPARVFERIGELLISQSRARF